jgi:methionyl-tRNA synthetase
MIAKNCEGKVPQHGDFSDEDREILDAAYAILDAARDEMNRFRLHKALEIIWKVVGDANRYFASQEPWALKKTDPERMNTVLYTTAEVIRVVAIAAQPFIPDGAPSCSTCCVSTKRSGSFRFRPAWCPARRFPSRTAYFRAMWMKLPMHERAEQGSAT